MTPNHETWMDEPQGKVRPSRSNRTILDAMKEHYHARTYYEKDAIDRETDEAAAEYTRMLMGDYTPADHGEHWERQSEALDYPN